jgi:hypothetical protein
MTKAAVEFESWAQPCVFSPKDSQRAALLQGFQSTMNGLQNEGNQWKQELTVSNGGKVRFDKILEGDFALSINLSRNGDDDGNPPADALLKCGTFQGKLFAALESEFRKRGYEVEHRAVATGARRQKETARTHWDEGCNFGFCVGVGGKRLICAPNSALDGVVDPSDKDRNINQNRPYLPLDHKPEQGASMFYVCFFRRRWSLHIHRCVSSTQAACPDGTWLIFVQATSSSCPIKCGTISSQSRLR